MSKPAESILKKSDAFSKRLASDFVAAAARLLRPGQQMFAFMQDFDSLLEQHMERFARAYYDASVASALGGAAGVVAPLIEQLPPLGGELPPIGVDPLSVLYPGDAPMVRFPIIDEAVVALTKSITIRPEAYYAIAANARRGAFTVTANLKLQTIDKMRDILSEVSEKTQSRTDFMAAVKKEFATLPISEAHLEQVFRNNVNSAYSDGGETALADPVVSDAFPFRAYYPIRDDRARPEHLALEFLGLSGTNVYHRQDPVWALFRPPWDWNCRCGWNPLTIRQAARKGVAVAQQWLDTGVAPANMFVPPPKFAPDPKWRRIT